MFATRLTGIAAFFLLTTWLALQAADSPVSAELVVPPAETHVIGDHTPLIWRFHNHSSEPLAFMWEGCCRLNGRLTVTADDQFIAPLPPGQALAHMFAKAERLEPGIPEDFETRLSDWVRLRDSGEYQLQGQYTGVLPEQTPQVPRGLTLWREAAVTPRITIRLTSVADYLAERQERSVRRGLRLELTGPNRLPPLQPSPFSLALVNASSRKQRVVWPVDFQLWIVDTNGHRLGNVPTAVVGAHQELVLSPDQRVDLTVPFDSGLIEGEAFGQYQVFVDLRGGESQEPRFPSNPVDLQWELGVAEIEQLLELAASGSRVGLRNAPLKLLRVYLSEIGGVLAAVDRPHAGAAFLALRDQLRLASCLKAHAPIPGRVELALEVSKDGTMRLAEPDIIDCLTALRRGEGDEVARLKQVLAVRRHLGWEIGLDVRPDPQVTVGAVFHGLQPYFDSGLELAGPPRALVPDQGTNMPTAVGFRPAFIPAGLLVRLRRGNNGITTAVARKAIAGSGSSMAALFKADEIAGVAFSPVADLGPTVQGLDPAVQSLVIADANLTWGELLEAVGPLLERRVPFDVCVGS